MEVLEPMGVHPGMLLTQILNFIILGVWIGLTILALRSMFRNRPESNLTFALWLLILVVFPILGSAAYLLSRIGARATEGNQNTEQHAG